MPQPDLTASLFPELEIPRVFVDPPFRLESRDPQAYAVGLKTGHMWSHMWCNPNDEGFLHTVAKKIGMRLAWFQDHENFPHYDLTPGRRAAALLNGAVEKDLREWIRERRAKEQRPLSPEITYNSSGGIIHA